MRDGGEKKDLTYSKRRGKQRFHKAAPEIGRDLLAVLIQLRRVTIGTHLNYLQAVQKSFVIRFKYWESLCSVRTAITVCLDRWKQM